MRTKALFIIIAVYGSLYVFTIGHSFWAGQTILEHESMSPEVEKAHLDYIEMAIAQTKIALGALIGALSSALTLVGTPPKDKSEQDS